MDTFPRIFVDVQEFVGNNPDYWAIFIVESSNFANSDALEDVIGVGEMCNSPNLRSGELRQWAEEYVAQNSGYKLKNPLCMNC